MIQMGKIEKLVLTELATMQKKGSSAGNKDIPVISNTGGLTEKKRLSKGRFFFTTKETQRETPTH